MESLYIADLLAGKEDRIGKYYYCFDPTILTAGDVTQPVGNKAVESQMT